MLRLLRGLPESAGSALVIGHNPGLEEFVLDLSAPGPLRDAVGVKIPRPVPSQRSLWAKGRGVTCTRGTPSWSASQSPET